jgi:hypothetical protein
MINGKRGWLWRAVDDAGEVLDILVQRRRSARAAKRFFRKLLNGRRMVLADDLGREPIPFVERRTISLCALTALSCSICRDAEQGCEGRLS